MPTAREVKKRIRSVKNISQITRALEAVSASKVRRAQARVIASRVFAEKAWEILLNVQAMSSKGQPLHPLLTEREDIKKILIVLITSDRGLAGAYNSNIIRVAQRFAERLGKPVEFITIGRKGRDSMVRVGEQVIAEFSDMPAEPSVADVAPIARMAIDEFLSGKVDDVYIAYTDFINMLTQRPVVLGWLPLIPHEISDTVASEYVKDVPAVTSGQSDYEFEPDATAILDEIVPRFTELQLYQALLESQASEHAARMVAMRNASDNASQLTSDLTLVYNKARQAAITSEILDIVGGAEALSDTLEAAASNIEKMMVENDAKANGNGAKPAKAKKAPASKPESGDGDDDLTKVEGIGPKMSAALKAAGIDTFAKLAASSEDTLRQAIEAAGMRLAPSITTWAEQAELAAKGDWDALDKLQNELEGGRRV